jgi:hypothetical protein
MGAISQDLSSAGMAAAIEAHWIAAFGHWSNAPRIELNDEEPDLRWYVTPGVPVELFNHTYFTRLADDDRTLMSIAPTFQVWGRRVGA